MEKAARMSDAGPIVDTNVIVRLLRKEDAQHAAAKAIFIEAAARGRPLVLMDVVLAEAVFVLSCVYKYSRHEVADMLAEMLAHPAVASTRPEMMLEALTCYRATKLHFVDCYLIAVAKATGRKIATFDKELERFGGAAAQGHATDDA